jgi:hypothetical protein
LYKISVGDDEVGRVRSLARQLGITLTEQVGVTSEVREVYAQIPKKP